MKRNLTFISIAVIPILLFLFSTISLPVRQAGAEYQKTEQVGKIVADTMPEGVSLKWDDPAGYEKVIVVRNLNHLPKSSTDGEVIYQGNGKAYFDKDIQPATTYYYAVIFVPQQKTYTKRVREIIAKPLETFQSVPAPTKAAVVSTSAGSQLLLFLGMFDSLKDFWFTIFRAVQALLIFMGLRSKKKNGWGIVYDWKTKEPLKNVVLNLISERKEKVASVVSDEAGRFGFLVEAGNYYLEVGSYPHYAFRPESYGNTDLFGNIYRGELIAVKSEELLALNVPLLSTVPESEKKKARRYRLDFTRLKSSKILNAIIEFSFWIGFIFIVLSLFGQFTIWKLLITVFYGLVFLLRLYLMKVIKNWGLVLSERDKKPVPFAVVRAFRGARQEKEQAAVSVSDSKGGFYLLVPPDEYDVSIKGRTLMGENFDKETAVSAKKGLINGVYYV